MLKNTPLRNMIINASYIIYPPIIWIERLEKNLEDVNEGYRRDVIKMRDTLGSNQMLMCIQVYRTHPALRQLEERFPISTSILDGPDVYYRATAEASPGFLPVSAWARSPATNPGGKDLAFEIDEIDRRLFDAQRYSQICKRLKSPSKPKSAYEYLEVTIASGK